MRRVAVCLALLSGPVQASDGVVSTGLLSNQDLYRAAACGAVPKGACKGPFVRWAKQDLIVALSPIVAGVPKAVVRRVDRALDQAIETLNHAGAAVQIIRDDAAAQPDVLVLRSRLKEGEATRNVAGMPDGEIIGVGYMYLNWNAANQITKASILIAADIDPGDIRSVVLEELTQTLGLLYDIENPDYVGVSILSQDSNATTEILGQDRAILRLHYPKN